MRVVKLEIIEAVFDKMIEISNRHKYLLPQQLEEIMAEFKDKAFDYTEEGYMENREEIYRRIKDELHEVYQYAPTLKETDDPSESERVQILAAMNAMNLAIEAYKYEVEGES